jgi:phage host-nuclease inhibitor protein Gam
MEIPITAISPNQLPAETPLKLDEIYRIIGSLYLDSYHKISTLEDHFKTIIEQYADQLNQLKQENDGLRRTLEDNGK